eukprot:TRINITY_DN476_c0_g1_i4.p1 TRINITY_DN476_c0_g1~~TRINITY_DN476_c0_g1_i4.p1  ORF type:complete len:626 (+),score=196.36 TRINITY_DN476_c0_g1_i4:232-2109(+)
MPKHKKIQSSLMSDDINHKLDVINEFHIIESEAKPLRLVQFMVDRPHVIILTALFIMAVSVSVIIPVGHWNEFPSQEGGFQDNSDIRTLRQDGFTQAQKDIGLKGENVEEVEQDTQSQPGAFFLVLYHGLGSGGQVFTSTNVDSIRKVENKIRNDPDIEDFCYKIRGNCLPPLSSMNYFYPSAKNVSIDLPAGLPHPFPGALSAVPCVGVNTTLTNGICPFPNYVNSITPAGIIAMFSAAVPLQCPSKVIVGQKLVLVDCVFEDGNGSTRKDITATLDDLANRLNQSGIAFYFDKGFDVGNLKSNYTRSQFIFGRPLAGFKNVEDRPLEQNEKFTKWALKFIQDFESAKNDNLEILYLGTGLSQPIIDELLIHDGLLAFASFAFVVFYLRFHTGSWFLASLGMTHVLMSFPVAYFVYLVILNIRAFYGLNFLSIYIILAIGADDIFVFVDAYKQSNTLPFKLRNSLVHRMSWTWRRASHAMLITSLTTTIAFSATAVSQLVSVSVFGLFTAMLVVCNYLFVITWFPCVVILYNRNYENAPKRSVCQCCRSSTDIERENFRRQKEMEMQQTQVSGVLDEHAIDHAEPELGSIERFFRDKYAPWINGPPKYVNRKVGGERGWKEESN